MSSFSLFSVIGIEIEYMLVDRENLNVQAKSDLILEELAGRVVNEVAIGKGELALSNELVLHVLELKNNGPKPATANLATQFQNGIAILEPILAKHDLQLLPTGAHPWMDPHRETQRWEHDNQEIYQQFDSIFNCQGHGWANLQSMHLNLPYANDQEFAQLHNAIRLLLPLLPALAASTPFLDGKKTGLKDSRLDFYGKNQQKIPSISGSIIPEFVCSEAEYQDRVLQPMYRDIHPFDPQKILQHSWLNSRAAIPKFACKAIEIRIIDTQECVQADIAIALAVFAILKHYCRDRDYYLHNPCPTERLKSIYNGSIKDGLALSIDDSQFMKQWQLPLRQMNARDIWSTLIERVSCDLDNNSQVVLETLLSQGNLAERLLRSCGNDFSKANLRRIYRQLGHCLSNNQLFTAV